MQAFELDRPERLRAHLAQNATVYEVQADGQGGEHWESVTVDDQTAFRADAATPVFPPSVSSLPNAKCCSVSRADSFFRRCRRLVLGVVRGACL